jgi:predicted Rossmann fold nucleotide-binding protein DprA/Smf involved in DNA uptake
VSLDHRTFALHLALTPGIGGKSVTRVLARNTLLGRTPLQFLALTPESWREEYRLSAKATENLRTRKDALRETSDLERRLEGLGVTLVTMADAHYPAMIEQFDPDPPGVLFLYGNQRLLNAETFCVLSSRNARLAQLDWIERLTEAAVLDGKILVTGHDRIEYQRSAVVPLRWGAPRILCLDRGLFRVLGEDLRNEAFRAARLWRYEFDPLTDLVVSPFRPEADFIGVNNQVRDRLVASLSSSLAFVHISEGGNMDKLARTGLKCKRTVRIVDTVDYARSYKALGAELIDPLQIT